MAFVQRGSPAGRIFFETHGESGPWVTLLNGYTRSSSDFRALSRRLVQAGLRTLVLDNRGAGQTESADAFSLQDMADDVAAVWDHLGFEATHVVGISMGGVIAQRLAETRRLEGLVLVSTFRHAQYLLTDEDEWSHEPDAMRERLSRFFSDVFRERNAPLIQAMARQMAKSVAQGNLVEGAAAQRRALAELVEIPLQPPKAERIHLVHGDEDRVIPIAAMRDAANDLGAAEVSIFAGAGHLLLAERPQELAATIIAFLGGR